MNGVSEHRAPLCAAGAPPETVESLERYLDLLAVWASRTNLTAAQTAEERVQILVTPVLPGIGWVQGTQFLDVGSGSGSPGLVLALLAPQLRVILLEPRQKRWAFLREACRAVARPDIEVRRQRLQQYTGPHADLITLRAVSLPAPQIGRWLLPGGRALVWGEPLSMLPGTNLKQLPGTGQPLVYEHVSRETGPSAAGEPAST